MTEKIRLNRYLKKTTIIFSLIFFCFGCKSLKSTNYNLKAYLFSEDKSNLLLIDDFRKSGESLILLSPYKYNWKYFSYVTKSVKNDTLFFTNVYKQNFISINFKSSYKSKRSSITLVDEMGKVLNVPYNLIINDTVTLNSNTGNLIIPKIKNIENSKIYLSDFDLLFLDDHLKFDNDSIVLELDNSKRVFLNNKQYTFENYFILNSNGLDSSLSINLAFGKYEFLNSQKVYFTNKESKQFNIFKKFKL